jgi:adenosylcobinamide-phosphate synthase
MLRDGGATASPNAGRPMAAMAGALGVRLEKPGHHLLNARGAAPGAADIGRAMRVARAATMLAVGSLAGGPAVLRRLAAHAA